MKKLVDVENEGLLSLVGEVVTLMCANYFYTGKLIGVNADFVKLEDPMIVYETGPFSEKDWKDAQRLPERYWYVMISAVEGFGIMK